ncbi:MAG TPA: twin-arginine translocase TatA/TatE family subunit [Anaerolineales bacterium]|nr:twin-arginine translocase TatA/TatE family subunit [Anaerolineales bacterium]
MFRFGTTELIIVLVIVLLLFGVGRIGKIAGELGKGIREFRTGLTGNKDEEKKEGEITEQPDDKG